MSFVSSGDLRISRACLKANLVGEFLMPNTSRMSVSVKTLSLPGWSCRSRAAFSAGGSLVAAEAGATNASNPRTRSFIADFEQSDSPESQRFLVEECPHTGEQSRPASCSVARPIVS